MADRTVFWERFGPMILESMFLTMLDELNTIRTSCSMSELTQQEILDKLVVKHNAAISAENDAAKAK